VTTKEEKLKLALEYPHERDAYVFFDEEPHKYYIYDVKNSAPVENLVSITTFIHKYCNEFDADKIIEKMMLKADFNKGKYAGMTPDDIKNKWTQDGKNASGEGTKMHRHIELFYNDVPLPPANECSVELEYFKKFHADIVEKNRWTQFRTEFRIYDLELQIVGTIDIVFIPDLSRPLEIIIYDWKRSKGINKSNRFQTMKDPISYLDDCNWIHYNLQLNLYKYLLEKNYGFKVIACYLGIFHPDNSSYVTEEIKFAYGLAVDELLDDRRKQLLTKNSEIKISH
jgi:hypothetical protein